MPQITINSVNIDQFGYSATADCLNQTITFDTANLTTYNDVSGQGSLYVLGIAFSVIDQSGLALAEVDWNDPQIQPALGETEFVLNISNAGIDYFFQKYKVIAYIKDGDGTVYEIPQVNKKICQPVGITEAGYVVGNFQLDSNCNNNQLTVKELTVLVYNKLLPTEVVKDGNLYYPTGTISPVPFTGTPFTNNEIITGQYRINCDTVATYDIGDDYYVNVTYTTDEEFPVTCSNKIEDVLCCIAEVQQRKINNCNNVVGTQAQEQLDSILIPFLQALGKQSFGQDASTEVAYIRKQLRCNCGVNKIIRNEFTPINGSISNIVIDGRGGTTVAPPTINGQTKTYTVKSSVYQVVKADTGDNSFTITVDDTTPNVVKYKIAINYTVLAATILTQISNNSALLTQFNSLVNITNFAIDLSNLNGGCIIDLSSISYFLSLKVPSGDSTIDSIIINGTTYNAPDGTTVNNPTAVETWLNGLALGTFNASYSLSTSGAYFNILTEANANTVTSATITIISSTSESATTVQFQKTNKSIVAFLQAVVDYICNISALQVTLGQPVSLCYIDYNGVQVNATYPQTDSQGVLNAAFASALCNSILYINRTFNNALDPQAGGVVQWGGSLLRNTTINQNGFVINFQGDSNNYVAFNNTSFLILNRAGIAVSDSIQVTFTRNDLFVAQLSTNGDRANTAYLAKAEVAIKNDVGVQQRASIGVKVPTTLDAGIAPAPANVPAQTAFVSAIFDENTGFGGLEFYGQTQTHTGSSSNFDTLLRFKSMTTAERDAIAGGLLVAGIVIFNSDVSSPGKLQCYNGSTWNNLW
jgi:hypothetical protein